MEQIKHQAGVAMTEADVIVFVVSGKEGVTDADEYVARILYKTNKPVILAVNTAENTQMRAGCLGFPILLKQRVPRASFQTNLIVHEGRKGTFSPMLSLKIFQQKSKKKIQISSVSVFDWRPNVGKCQV